MYERSRRIFAVFGLAFLVVILVIAALSTLDSYQRENREARNDKAKADAAYAHEQIEAECIRVSGAVSAECVADAKRAADHAGRPDDDLKAQQDMAQWTYLGAWTAIIGVVITGAGVVYVALTLNETRKATGAAQDAVKATWEIGRKQVRAYLSIVRPNIRLVYIDTDERKGIPHFRIRGKIRNTGQSAAIGVSVWVACSVDGGGKLEAEELEINPVSASSASPFTAFVLCEDSRDQMQNDRISRVSLSVSVNASDVFGDKFAVHDHFYAVWGHGLDRSKKMLTKRLAGRRLHRSSREEA